ncbi:LysR family transcriptional regulator [Ramlibacter algicola]|uniref:LysR family transcriptional regulator n=1 Tax=Ramlibacter algicola TaxID=2795217 RepID=A0A934Q0W2_9BURK|nr:LysR substrate-binding domain-containing protein [Ramlibacter algicola]MBK0392791.1 LysR family transcriptional regulator [Ramlibacter algicola]
MRFDLTDLRVFLQACDSGSMTEAASRCALTLAAVSARIRALEDEAGAALLQRHARGVTPTPAGEALARHARVVLHQAEALRRDLEPARVAQDPPLVLLANSSALLRPLHRAVADVATRHPHARILLRESGSEATVHAVHSGAADLGVVSDSVATAGTRAEPLGPDPLVMVVPSSHPLARRESVRLHDALVHDWIGWGEGSALQMHLVVQASRAGGVLVPKVVAPSGIAVLELVARGLGISVVPEALLPRAADRAAVRVLSLDEAWARRKLVLCLRDEEPSPLARAMADALHRLWHGEKSPA